MDKKKNHGWTQIHTDKLLILNYLLFVMPMFGAHVFILFGSVTGSR